MKSTLSIFIILPVLICGCTSSRDEPINFNQVILLDVHGLWGGNDLWIDRDGNVICRKVAQSLNADGKQDSRIAFKLTDEQMQGLSELLRENDFFTIKTEQRTALPDTAYPILYVKSGDRAYAVGKWADDEHERFDAIYDYLIKLAESADSSKAFHREPFSEYWSPPGFPTTQEVVGQLER